MMHFAELSVPEFTSLFTAFLTILATMLAGFYALANKMLNNASKERIASAEATIAEKKTLVEISSLSTENDRAERLALIAAIERMAQSSQEVADATKQAAREAEERNGHLGEQNLRIIETVEANRDRILEAVSNIKEQHVEHQTVEQEDVTNKG